MKERCTKIFCIGFHKTGTTSLGKALKILGYKVKGPFGIHDKDIHLNALTKAKKIIPKFDAFQDNPWPLLYQELDNLYPESKFILTIRNGNSWVKSQIKYFGKEQTEMRKWIYGYGSPVNNEQIYLDTYNRHNESVISYFKSRPKDILVMNLEKDFNWTILCDFLNVKNTPEFPFPYLNKS